MEMDTWVTQAMRQATNTLLASRVEDRPVADDPVAVTVKLPQIPELFVNEPKQ